MTAIAGVEITPHHMDMIDMIVSMNLSISRAHGIPLSLEAMKSMTVFELIELLAPNKIRFCVED